MAVAKITRQGLTAMAILVALLWTCLLAERILVRNANRQYSRTLREIRLMQIKRRPEPVSAPAPALPRPPRPTVG